VCLSSGGIVTCVVEPERSSQWRVRNAFHRRPKSAPDTPSAVAAPWPIHPQPEPHITVYVGCLICLSDRNTICLPSGDQPTATSVAGWYVTRCGTPPPAGMVNTSVFPS
jgi:hypothetical protein